MLFYQGGSHGYNEDQTEENRNELCREFFIINLGT
jgi:hypothetical protein